MKISNMYLLNDRETFRIYGSETFDFLQSVITADITPLKENKAVASCLLSPQGRVMYDFILYPEDNPELSLVVDCYASEKEELIKKFSMYKLRSDVKIEDNINLNVAYSSLKDSTFFLDPRHKDLPYRYVIEKDKKKLLSDKEDEYKDIRLKLCIAEGPEEIPRGDALPLDFWMDSTSQVSFNKGCFIGQEVTARIFHRNKIRRRLITIEFNELDFDNKHLPRNFKYINKISDYLLLLAPIDFIKQFDENSSKPQIELINKKYNFYYYN